MNRPMRLSCLLSTAAVVSILLGARGFATSAQNAAPADLRAALEGTWQLEGAAEDRRSLRSGKHQPVHAPVRDHGSAP